jgi:two-component system CheB/CheR fusion protein
MSAQLMDEEQSLVVGIGASAGGLEALQTFFSNCPTDMGVSYVVVQHLSPDFKSMMDQLLSRCTDMPVTVAEDGEPVLRDHVYLIPPRKSMIIAEGALVLSDAAPHVSLSLPIDTFFRSLAEDQQHRSVGIILSGTGSDGSRGIAGIKEVGGLVLVQDPAEAKFDGMPNAALTSNYVDHAFRVEEMPGYLSGYKRSLYTLVGDSAEADYEVKRATSILDEICTTVQKHVHINLRDYKRSTIARRIDKRASLHQLTSWPEYLEFLKNEPDEQSALGKEILIGVTRFFRDADVFTTLREQMIPAILEATAATDELRIWCAGCSTGEEAYSIAICFDQVMTAVGQHRPVKIFATDIDADSIHEASVGQFGHHISEEMPREILKEYFSEHQGGYEVRSKIRQMVVFAVHNVISDPPFSNMDLVFCRNLLIYLGSQSQNKVEHYLNFALKKNGYLTLGPSESLIGELAENYEVVDRRFKQFQKIKVERKLLDSSNLAYKADIDGSNRPAITGGDTKVSQARDLLTPVFKELSETFAPATLVCNSRQEVIYSIGNCEPFTRKMAPGPSTLKIDSILDQSLVVAVTTAMQKAKREQKAVTYAGVALPDDSVVDLSVRYTKDPTALEEYLFVSFFGSDEPRSDHAPVQFDEKQMLVSRVEDLEYELQQTRSNLAVTVEELETSNEELQSTNEELMAANEELQSTNEELQSVNEELFSVNSEYQHKVMLLEETTADFENLLKNPSVSLIALDGDLGIKHFSPSVTQYFKLRSSDLDRSIGDINHSLGHRFVEDCSRVLELDEEMTTEYRTAEDTMLLARFTPYKNVHDENDGIVVSFTDVGESQMIQREKDELIRARAVLDRQHEQLATTLNPLLRSGETADLRVLIVEDSEADAAILINCLGASKLFNLRYEHCVNLNAAREVYSAGNFDVVMMDFKLGSEDATVALEANIFPNVPIILFSGLGRKAFEKLQGRGIYDYIEKSDLSTLVLEKSLHLTLQSYHVDQFLRKNVHFDNTLSS